ncbi:MAG TPA: thioredoxin-disulfide reductase [Candidatus Saccharimonas sp.]|nr:thioredoxin-disulfide reductase [Candidatus Saccharimonas sp.]
MSTRDVIIIGSGPAGLTAAIYAARAGLEPLMFEGEAVSNNDLPGGQLMTTTEVENFPGFPSGLTGPDLIAGMREQATRFGTEIIGRRITRVDLSARPFRVWAGDDEYAAASLIISTGARPRMLELDGIWDRVGHGVSTCATCDGFFFRGHDIAVVGGGDSALEEATYLSKFAKSVAVIHRRGELRASHAMQERAKADPKIRFVWHSEVAALQGEPKLAGLRLRDLRDGSESDLAVTGLFIAIGHEPNSQLFQDQLDLDEAGYIVSRDTRTNVPGVFACGDVQDHRYRQAITSAGSGCMAALNAQEFLAAQPVAKTAKA